MKFASIEHIAALEPIQGADKILLASILGWSVIVKKDEYKIGDFCVYIPIDTLVDPTHQAFKFLANKDKPNEWIRINTIKMRGVFSQGLTISLSNLPNGCYFEGQDVSNMLPIKKYEKENLIIASGTTTHFKPFPSELIPISDEDNLKTYKNTLEEFYDKQCYITLKMDGSSMTIIKYNDDFMVCSRRLILDEGSVMYQYVTREKIKDRLNRNLAIQGEFCGPKVNKNQIGLKDYKFFVFTIKDLDSKRFLNYEELKNTCNDLKLEMVPILENIIITKETTIQVLQELANKVEYTHPNNKKVFGEGIVIRPVEPVYSNSLNKFLSVKLINQNYKD